MAHLQVRGVILGHDVVEITPNYLEILLPHLRDCGLDLKGGLSSLVHDRFELKRLQGRHVPAF